MSIYANLPDSFFVVPMVGDCAVVQMIDATCELNNNKSVIAQASTRTNNVCAQRMSSTQHSGTCSRAKFNELSNLVLQV